MESVGTEKPSLLHVLARPGHRISDIGIYMYLVALLDSTGYGFLQKLILSDSSLFLEVDHTLEALLHGLHVCSCTKADVIGALKAIFNCCTCSSTLKAARVGWRILAMTVTHSSRNV